MVASTNGALTNVGIVAHIIGHAEGSARHEHANIYNFETLEDVRNLMLMCYHHSKLIDDKHTRNEFPPERLFQMKKDHEDWVRSWSGNKKKKSIALIHKKLGPPLTELTFEGGEAPFIMIEAVEDQEEFVNYTYESWEKAKRNNEAIYSKFKKKVREREANVAEVFPLSPIPLLIHLGFLLTDTVPLTVYQYDRVREVWVSEFQNPKGIERVQVDKSFTSKGSNELAVAVSVSGTIHKKDMEESLGKPVDFLKIGIPSPGVKRVLYKEDVKIIQEVIKDTTEEIFQANGYEKIHFFYAGPAGLAIEIGRGINPRIWSEVLLYEYATRSQPKYQFALKI
ncbi:hypothetical protein SAMD00020551_2425 [Mesobacillus selenatarsenatis SF-1]|uniref:SMODS-associated and fused to various effectors domain-containing protein n=1 Tax=Mesobacillus selenatarsenatis (strain DSM 18680 / JCM 14380 / FERM P-15431 / SF-1) TaxID=1321606 RepID=A0A0A8X7Z7_MESS1|nr:hypothetical protein SAMD00020551_2425 [Mesobacillus selenatarsenatis SF-1]